MRATRAFIAGILLGVLIGTAGLAAAAIGYKGWQGFSTDFKSGYIAGYLMMSKLARNLDPGGWVDEHYPYVLKATTAEWKDTIDAVYSKPENQEYSIESVLQIAAKELAEKHGAVSGEDRQYALLRQRLQAVREKQIANLKAKGLPVPPELEKPLTDVKLASPKTVAKQDRPKEKKRKWCRCDGTDPKAARAARRAAKEQAAKDAAAAAPPDAKAPPAAATKPAPAGEQPAH
ncbi:MAG TPA: hypothetical protein VN634_12250 [Candidatus Limnocylindrales bacterium]|nr:hypothetical protein [Candidatus Limnocylindrales bacterium]